MQLRINGSLHALPPGWQDESLLMVLREALGLTGTRFGCGQGQCGACTVLVDGAAAGADRLVIRAPAPGTGRPRRSPGAPRPASGWCDPKPG